MLNLQYNFEQIDSDINNSNINDISYNHETIEMLYDELFDKNCEIFNSTFIQEEEEDQNSVVYMYSIRPNEIVNTEEDWY
jgi:hypothetical protein